MSDDEYKALVQTMIHAQEKTLRGLMTAGDKEIFAEGLSAAMMSFAKALESAPRVWESSESRLAGLH